MAVYAEKRGSDYYLVRVEKDKEIPNVYVYSNGTIDPKNIEKTVITVYE
ncbi:hypothetical protein ACP3T3_02350 [Chryseobacterium sp. CBSDS_008]